MKSAKAFAPANISCIFKIYLHQNPRWMGSYGVGFTLNEGVTIKAEESKKNEVIFNNSPINFPTIKNVIEKLTKENIKIYVNSKLPLGCGFGLSGAGALASAYSINKMLDLKKSDRELAVLAHTAEVENKTGLGDVANQFYGGFCVKLRPSSYFIVSRLPIDNIGVYCRYFSKLSTRSIITNQKLKYNINKSASIALNKIKKLIQKGEHTSFSDVIKISKEFAAQSKLLKEKKTMQAIKEIEENNGNASMIMLGNAVFSDKPFKDSIRLKILNEGAHLL